MVQIGQVSGQVLCVRITGGVRGIIGQEYTSHPVTVQAQAKTGTAISEHGVDDAAKVKVCREL